MEQDNQNEQCHHQYSDQEPTSQDYNQLTEQDLPNQTEGLSKSQVGPIQLIYIMFSFYRKECDQLVQTYHCKIRFSINSYIIEQIGKCSKQQFGQCLKKVREFMNSIIIDQFKTQSNLSEKYRYYRSPYIHECIDELMQNQKKKIGLVMFHDKVYGYSIHLTKEAIKNEFVQLVKSIQIFSVCLFRIRQSHWKYDNWISKIYGHVGQYIELIFQHYKTYFDEKKLIVLLDQSKKFILIHGNRGKYLMQGKATIKNVIQSMVCLVIKDTIIDKQLLLKFLKKASLYPIYFDTYNNSSSILISKDNIIKQLIVKSPNFMKYLGISKNNQQIQRQVDPTIGFYIVPSSSIDIKMQKIKEKCQAKCYDLHTHMGIRYLRKVFIQQGKQQWHEHEYKQLLSDIMLCIEEFKQKFDVIKQRKQQEQLPQKEDDGLKYQILSGKTQNEELAKELKRDVLTEKIQMKKKFIIAYNVVQTKQQKVLWTVNKNGQQGNEIQLKDMKKGTFIRGLKKINQKGQEVRLFQELITVL